MECGIVPLSGHLNNSAMFFTRSLPPIDAEKRKLLAKRWDSLAPELQTPNQLAGKTIVACGATHHVMERCNFSCTCCYLGKDANKTKPLPFSEVKEQLDTMRAEFGTGGKVQITAGEVTLLPLEKLGRIVRYALEIGLDPMVMSHGQRFLEEPDYLIALVRDYGLRKISIHIDTTQRGRRGISSKATESDLHSVRDDFAKLIREVRRVTGAPLVAASTVTVTESNLGDVSHITRWFFRNADAFRLLSFLPVADVGRTRSGNRSVEREGLWKQIHSACNRPINHTPFQYGHSKCNNIVPLLLANGSSETLVIEGVRREKEQDEHMLAAAINHIGPAINWGLPWHKNITPFTSAYLCSPRFLIRSIIYVFYRILNDYSTALQFVKMTIADRKLPRLHPFLFVIHNFMSPGELTTKEGQERLDACIFKVPVDGKMISMCEMNATGIRAKLDRQNVERQQAEKEACI